MDQINEMENLVDFVLSRDIVGSIFTIIAWIVLFYNIYKYGKKFMMWIYRHQKGIEDSEEEQEDLKKNVKTLKKELDNFKDIHDQDMKKLIERQDEMMKEMKNSVLVTITGLAHYYGTKPFKVGAVIKLKKEYDNKVRAGTSPHYV